MNDYTIFMHVDTGTAAHIAAGASKLKV